MFQIKIPLISTVKTKFYAYRFLFWVKVFEIFGTTDLSNFHLGLNWTNGALRFTAQPHGEYLKSKTRELRLLKKQLKAEDFVCEAIYSSRKCQFICFTGKDEGTFVQFWLADRSIFCSWPLAYGNNLSHHTLAMLGVLNEMNITRTPTRMNDWPFSMTLYYKMVRTEQFDDYQVFFGREYELMGEFANRVVTDVFGEKLEDIKAKIG